ncbi:phosphate transport system substrate-binding protein [Microbacteriaceae bacterium SG_E_30_P1]|uniref:Phosphate-binding protein n=1 Tax=Antiquaquibacter oligotrophicus TaxID=2880260 RepID=A0ABT6KLJ4_9MICO|nr:phosphate ABC transporter substrate-binding protein PstS [Antiquaquibacter oligotrophicus]MDH6180054.1 phosphate transport system substrate-binding protein [Antiquaquibacter oligotrophicus]UDF14194.1 phosphate ABC transporter substrate-binding protein PstS [Antiquaquibacter oligotrophicus]
MIQRGSAAAAAVVIAAALLTGCAVNEMGDTPSDLEGTIDGSGASSQSAAQEVWVAGFQRANAYASVNYDPVGSGAGRTAFLAGGSDFAGSDSPLNDKELAGEHRTCAEGTTAIDLPLYISPIAVVFNVAGLDELRLDGPTLARIFADDVTRWDDPALVELNPGVDLPDAAITAVHRSDDSGTTTNFTEYLDAVAATEWGAEPSGTFPYLSGESALGNSGVVAAVEGGRGTIGYVDASKAGQLDIASIRVGDDFVQPTADGAAAIVELSPRLPGRTEHDIALDVDRASEEPGVYPLVLISYLIVCQEYRDANTAELVRAYLTHIASDAGQADAQDIAGSAPLAPSLRADVQAAIDSIQ